MPFASAAGRTASIAASITGMIGVGERSKANCRHQPRSVQQVVDQLRLGFGVAEDGFQGVCLFIPGEFTRLQDLSPADDRMSGVRSSWLTVARNSSFKRLAISAFSRSSFFARQQIFPFGFDALALDKLTDFAADGIEHV
jgi:hypothetical protein